MAFKVNSLFPFDRNLFGKTMAAWDKMNRGQMLHPTKHVMNSADDLNRYFSSKYLVGFKNTLWKNQQLY